LATKKKDDPTVSTESVSSGYPEGTHPALPPEKTHHSATRITYKDNPDKPDPSSVAQIAVFPDDWS
jgi:hypothetical protein